MKSALVTGGSRGIGRSVADKLLSLGFNCALIARNNEELVKTADELQLKYIEQKVCHFACDVSHEASVRDAVASTEELLGPIEVVFNNAGIYKRGSLDLTGHEFEEVIRINLLGASIVARETFPLMMKRRRGFLINLSSVCGKKGFAGTGAYSASKFGLLGLNDALFREAAGSGVRVTAICPSWVNTQMAEGSYVPRDRMIQPEDIAKTVEYLLSLSQGACPKEIVIECLSDIL
jgi:3-oxoacyl-[acyl-carrier protein] reductase